MARVQTDSDSSIALEGGLDISWGRRSCYRASSVVFLHSRPVDFEMVMYTDHINNEQHWNGRTTFLFIPVGVYLRRLRICIRCPGSQRLYAASVAFSLLIHTNSTVSGRDAFISLVN